MKDIMTAAIESVSLAVLLGVVCLLVAFAKDVGYREGKREAENDRMDNFFK